MALGKEVVYSFVLFSKIKNKLKNYVITGIELVPEQVFENQL